jgi:hypothetical protein
MPIHYTIDEAENLIRVTHDGPFTIEEMIRHSQRVNADPRFVPGMNTLTDLREASLADRVEAIREYVAHSAELQKTRGPCRWACLVADEAARDLIDTFDLVARQRGVAIRTRAFRDLAEAEAWVASPE